MQDRGVGQELLLDVIFDKFHDQICRDICIFQDLQVVFPIGGAVGKRVALMIVIPCEDV